MDQVSRRLSELSPEQRALLMMRLKKKSQETFKSSGIPKRKDPGIFPMSYAQERMWFLDQWKPGSPLYNISAAVRISGGLDEKIFQRCLEAIVNRHDSLRAVFPTQNGQPLQLVSAQAEFGWQKIDLSNLAPEEQNQQVLQLATEEAQCPFQLAQGPLFRVTLLHLNPTDHVVLLTMHHIISDGWSMGTLIREIAALYNSSASGTGPSLPENTIQYADYAQWQRDWLADGVLEQQLSFWKNQLDTGNQLLELPTDFPRPAQQSIKGAHQRFTIPAKVTAKLQELSQREEITLFMMMLAAFKVLLHRYSGAQDISVGAPIANRNRKETEGVIGLFVNTLILRTRLEGNPTFREFMHQVREVALNAFAHPDVPFEKLVEALQPHRDMSHTPFFQVMFDLQKAPLQSFEMNGLKFNVIETESGTAKFDLVLMMVDEADHLRGMFEYNTDIFAAATIDRMIDHFQCLLVAIAANPDQPIATLNLMQEAERDKIVYQWNATARDYPRDKCVHELFQKQVVETPDAIAVVYGNEQLSYRGLNIRANLLANYLIKQGVQPNDLVAIYMERSLEMIVATLAILKAGAAYVPMDLSYPKPRIGFMLQDTGARLVLTQKALVSVLPENAPTVCIDTDWQKIALESRENPQIQITSDCLAYIIYTSGSTGIPKGVPVPHLAITRLVLNTDYIDIQSTDRIAQVSNASFDAATFEIWGALLNGAMLVGITKEVVLSSYEFVNEMRSQKIDSMFLTTALFNQLANEIPGAFKTLKYVLFGGEACDPDAVRKVALNDPPEHLLNVYGPTENTTFSTWFEVENVAEGATTVPIGKPIANSTCYVLDKNLLPVPVGIPGELYVGGDGLSVGYYKRPELSAEKYIPNPFASEPGSRLYKTGDLVCLLPDGAIEFIARIDLQVKIRGFRIELGEIESVLKRYPTLKDAVVIAREDNPGDKRLVAYIVPAEEPAPSTSDLRKFLAEKLPEFMVPAIYVPLKAIPITPNGKIDKKALPVPDQSRPDLDKPYVAPRNKLEHFLAEMWQEVLGLQQIGIFDNFFELGGNSIQAAVFINRIQKKFGETAHVSSIFMAPTIAEFSMYVNEYYSHLVEQYFGEESIDTLAMQKKLAAGQDIEKIRQEDLSQIRQIIPPLAPRKSSRKKETKNPPMVFLLSPPRSGSTLFRVMLAGNPHLFAPPELDLLSFNSLKERQSAFTDHYSIWLEATIRAIMEIKSCSAEQATQIMTECEDQDLSVKDFYRLLQEWIGARILVDKTPSYPLSMDILRRAESDFDQPYYIHLMRHPYATIYSFLEAKLDQNFFRYPHPFSRRELAELIWIVCHQNILAFLQEIPPERQINIKFEDLVVQPEPILQDLCRFLNIEYHPDMMKPYEGKKMTDGVSAKSQMVGDFKFYLHKNIDAKAADRWKRFHADDFLSDLSWQLAEQLGYPKPDETTRLAQKSDKQLARKMLTDLKPVPRDSDLVLSFQQQRLWFLDQFDPGSTSYNVPVAVRFLGAFDIAALRKALNDIVRRHEVLRSNFKTVEGKPVIVIHPELALAIPEKDLSGLPESIRETEAQREASIEARRPFDLARTPLIRGSVLKLNEKNHVVLITLHHIVSDGWSIGVLLKEFRERYEAVAAGKDFPIHNLPIQYVDYAYWQRQWLKEEVLKTQLDYWREKLAGSPPLLELPTDRPRPAEVTYNGASKKIVLSKELTRQIKKLSQGEEVTSFMTLLAAFKILLYRYSGQMDISVGTPLANRGRVEIEGLIGFFVNTLVLRSKLDNQSDFRTLVKQVRETALGAFGHPDLPFEMLVDELQPERSLSHTPLFQVMFAFQDTLVGELNLPELKMIPFQNESITAKFDMTLSILEKEGEFRGSWEYNTDLFDGSTIERMIGHFTALLEAIVAAPDKPIIRLSLLPKSEATRILDEWNRTYQTLPDFRCIHQIFEAQVQRTPEALAVVFGAQQLSYQELNARANQLGRYLQLQGVGPDVIVGLCMERSVDMIVAIMGILKAGAAYLPMDPTYPKDRIAFMLEDARVPVLITQAEARPDLLEDDAMVICLDTDWSKIAGESDMNFASGAEVENLAYVIYTSGSTGKPKGVMIQHQSAINLHLGLTQAIYAHHPGENLRVSLNAPLPFDASVQQLVMLMSGHTLYILPQEVRGDGESMLAFIRENQLDVLDCVPSQLKLMLNAGLLEKGQWQPAAILPGGEAIDEVTWSKLAAAKSIEFYNMYGPTECTVDSTIGWIRQLPEKPTIGRPVCNARMYILDSQLQPVPAGVFGELYIGGAGLARGYLDRPELTAEKFIPDLFGQKPGERLYRTGDLVRYLPDGQIEFTGRIDHQVKVRGFRIELGEIEAVLVQHPGIRDVAVVVREDVPGDRRIVAYFIAQADQTLTVGDLRTYLKGQLPEYMVPAIFVQLDAMPLLPNGKVDRKALPIPDQGRPELSGDFVAPTTATEEKLAEIWRQILGLERVGIHDNFFELGGDSILSIQVISKANQAGIHLSPKHLFLKPTIAGLAALAGTARSVRAEQGIVTGEIPLTPIQRQFFELNLETPQHWNQAILLKVSQPLEQQFLEPALQALVLHHDALRLQFTQTETGWRQENAAVRSGLAFAWIDLSGYNEAEQRLEIEAKVAQLQASLQLDAGMLLTAAYFNRGPAQSGRLFLAIHHLAVDAISWRILLEDLQTAYGQLKQGGAIKLPAKTTAFRHWALRLSEFAQSTDLRQQVAFWAELAEKTVPLLPVDLNQGSNSEAQAKNVAISLSVEETRALLQEVPKAYGTEINDILLTALVQAFAGMTGQPALLLEMEGHGREDIFDDMDISRTVGWFTTTFPVYLDLNGSQTPVESIWRVKAQLRNIPNRGFGFGLLRYLTEDADTAAQMRMIPEPQVSFNYLGQLDQTLPENLGMGLAPESSGPAHGLANARKHLLDINGYISGGQLHLTWTFGQELHHRATIEKLAADYLVSLRKLIEQCQTPEIGALTPAEFPDLQLSQDELENILDELK